MVFYRKYRPQTFTEIIGQVPVKEALINSLKTGTTGHAYLFCGPRGLGKTSTARILAKAINCEKNQELRIKNQDKKARTQNLEPRTSPEPCNECASCTAIMNGSHLDVIEIDAASNRGIDDVRELRERIKLSPTSAKKKVYIIDEVHMLTTEAFNALLKTLEEPPEHAVLILATTEPQKLPQTILSRCQKFTFQLASNEDLQQAIEHVAKAEKIKITKEAIGELVTAAEGSFRDCVKLLDQLVQIGKPITPELVASHLQTPQTVIVQKLFDLLLSTAEEEIFTFLAERSSAGDNLKELTTALLKYTRDLLFIHAKLGDVYVKPQYPQATYKQMAAQASAIAKPTLTVLLRLLVQAQKDSRVTTIAELPLELAVLEFLEKRGAASGVVEGTIPATAIASSNEVLVKEKPAKKSSALQTTEAKLSAQQQDQTSPAPEEVGAMLAETSDSIVIATAKETVTSVTETQVAAAFAGAEKTDEKGKSLALIEKKWPTFLEHCLEKNHSLTLLLKNATVKHFDGKKLTLEVLYKFHKERLESEKIRKAAEENLYEVFGQPILLSLSLAQKPHRKRPEEDLDTQALEVFQIDG